MFKPSIYRISSYFLSLYGIDGSWDDLQEIVSWVRNHFSSYYPKCLQKKWPMPVGKLYGYYYPSQIKELSNIEMEFKSCWQSYQRDIKESIASGNLKSKYD